MLHLQKDRTNSKAMLLPRTGSSINTIKGNPQNQSNKEPTSSLPSLMRIPISFYNIKAQALVDTGAAASFISLSLLKKLPFKNWWINKMNFGSLFLER